MLNKKDATLLMNRLGKEQQPFFFMVDFLQENTLVIPLNEINPEEIQFEMQDFSVGSEKAISTEIPVSLSTDGYAKTRYVQQFNEVVTEIKKGNSFLVNLTCETPVKLTAGLRAVYNQVHAKYKLRYQDQFVVFSPETFVRIKQGVISSFPMKGTLDASFPDAAKTLLKNPKEKAEHSTIVDLIRNDLSMVAERVEVVRFRYLDELVTDSGKLLQVSSEISGHLPEDYGSRIGTIVFQLLPAGSITGAPKNKTVDIIRQVETYERGFYSGVFGVFDGQNMDSAVMIRFIEQTPNGFVYKSGGGITAFSDPEEEYDEMLKKIYVPVN